MKNALLRVLLLTAALLIPGAGRAHHGWAAFTSDPESQITLKGTVKEFHFVNPHSVIELAVKDKGQIIVWEGELTSNTNLAPRGWTAITLEDRQNSRRSKILSRNTSSSLSKMARKALGRVLQASRLAHKQT